MSAASDAANIGALSSALYSEVRKASPNSTKLLQLTQKLCDDLTAACQTYGPGAGLTPSQIEYAIQGGGTSKTV